MLRNKILLVLLALFCLSANAKINDKFMKKATEEVWSMDLPAFDPNTEIPDSILQGNSAVIIAYHVLIDADHKIGASASKGRTLGNAQTDIVSRKVIRRYMVKLLDDAAVEDYSSVDITGGDVERIDTYTISTSDEAFGARIYKPSGEVIDVDVSKALSVTSGKKGKDEVSRRLAIPSLAPGDVLEYFVYQLDEIDEFSPDPIRVVPFQRYPVLNFMLNGAFDPTLTVEYRTVNDAPLLESAYDDKGNLTVNAHFKNLPAIPSIPWFLPLRQLPFYRFVTLNNQSLMVWHSKLSRKPGLYPDIPAPTYYQEVGEILCKIKPNEDLVKDVVKYMKSYIKANPETPRRKLIERAWVATLYYYMTNPEIHSSDVGRALAYREVLKKLKLDDSRTGLGFINSRNDIPTDCLLSYVDLDYVAVVGDTIYQSQSFTDFAPGEFPEDYQGELGAAYYTDFSPKEGAKFFPEALEAPTSKSSNNIYYSEVELNLDVDNQDFPAKFSRLVTASGTTKGNISLPVGLGVWAAEAERYLEIPEKDRYVASVAEQDAYRKKLKEVLLDNTELTMGIRPKELTDMNLVNYGCFPDAKKRMFNLEGVVEGLVTDAGDGELIVDVGKLFGKNHKLTGAERERIYDAVIGAPSQSVFVLKFNVPDGYKVDESALESLNQNIQNPTGCYSVQTNISEDGKLVTVSVMERYNAYVIPVDYWSNFLAIVDAAADFNSVSLVLSPE